MNDLDFLLEEEKKLIQEEIAKKYNNEKEEKDEPTEPESLKKKKKNELIENFLKLQETAGGGEWDDKKLRRLNKDEIIKLTANFMNAKIEDKETKIIENPQTGKPEMVEMPREGLTGEKLNLVANGIYAINKAFIQLCESGSVYLKDKTYGIAVLEGWSQKIETRKQDLIIIFSQLYYQYKDEMDKYLSPAVQYGIILIQTGTSCAIENLKKKKEEPKEN